jgi:hypothetical protein
MKPFVVGLIGLALCGCAPDRSVSDLIAGDRVQGDAAAVVVSRTDSLPDALPLAIGHCAHFHRAAQYAGRVADRFRFRCVAQ